MTWLTPDGREIRLGSFSPERAHRYSIDQDERLARKMRGVPIIEGLLGDPQQESTVPLNGTYQLLISSLVFEADANVEAEMIIYGQVAGLAGTDNERRDLMVALLWGTPIALAFGFLGAIVTSLISMLIAAIGAWYNGWLDEAIQRITDVNIILPTLPVAIMVFVMYSRSIWSILWVIVLLNIFGTAIKNYRSVFLQVKESGYIEGAQAYGASNLRIILVYLIPRIIPVLIPQLVIMVPGFVFYEATLAYLGLSDPLLPTWGKVIHDAVTNGLYQGNYYWVLQPVGLLVLTGLAFALLGFALDRVTNPRLRDI
jgi:peptide/nickel transport system permease protein